MPDAGDASAVSVPDPLRLFYCYASRDRPLRDELSRHLAAMKREGIIVDWFDGDITAGQVWDEEIKDKLDEADVILLLISSAFFASDYINNVELKRAMERHRLGTARVIPIVVEEDCGWRYTSLGTLQALPTNAASVTAGGPWLNVVEGIRRAAAMFRDDRLAADDGVVSAVRFRTSKHRFAGETYAIELLHEPIVMTRTSEGLSVTIDRAGVDEYIISNEGKRTKCEKFVTDSNRADIISRDWKIQSFLAGRRVGKHTFDAWTELSMRLRWASGGVMSIIHRAGEPSKEWVPFFFRDIPPYGWNLALGSAERQFDETGNVRLDYTQEWELGEPTNYILREFIEETMILSGDPSSGRPVRHRTLRPAHGGRPLIQGRRFDSEHRRLRKEKDGLVFLDDPDDASPIHVSDVKTDCELILKDRSKDLSVTHNVLVSFSLLDLGIEVVQVKRYEIGADDYFLDGEIQPGDVPGSQELVRMPMALLSMDYLRRTFGGRAKWKNYTSGQSPSIEVKTAPSKQKGEIVLFPYDVARRIAILGGGDATPWETRRYRGWLQKFGRNFVDQDQQPSVANASRRFVPGAAKTLHLYFAQK